MATSRPRDIVLKTAQAGSEKRTTYTQLDNKTKSEQLILSKIYLTKWL
jgi:hypothetical protein